MDTTSESVNHGGGGGGGGANVFFLPFPAAQGHTNPMLQFGRRLAYHGLRPTLVLTRYVLSCTDPPGDPFRVAAISDGFDAGGMASCPDHAESFSRMEAAGSETLRELLLSEARAGRPVRVLVYDPHLAWALPVARAAGVATAAFFSQPCAVNVIYGELWAGRMALPATDGRQLVARGALSVELGPEDMPPFVAVPESQPVFTRTSIRQFEGLDEADDVLVNSFHDLEPKEASNKENNDSELFQKVFSEGPLEELVTRCDVITAASLVGSSKLFFDSANDSATLSFSLPFGLPCVLHSHPTKVARDCKLTPLDRFSSDAVMPDGTGKQWVGANGDWVAMVDTGFPACKWKLVNVYTRREIPLPVPFETTHIPNIYHHNLRAIIFHKIYICQVPTAAGGYKNFSLVAVFDISVALLCGEDSGWTVLTEPKSHIFYNYSDAILHNGLVFATTHTGTVHAWNPQQAAPPLIVEPPPILFEWRCALDDALGHDHEVDYGMWWLARSIDGSRLLLIHTLGIADEREYSCKVCHTASDRRVHHGRTVGNYVSGFGCLVFTKDTSKLNEGIPWEKIDDLGEYSLFLGVNYPIMLPLGGADVVPGCLTRRNCVYTLPNEAWLRNSQLPEICRFSLNREDCAVGFQTNALEKTCRTKKDRYLVKTPLWFIPNFANAPDWNKCDV